MNSHCDYTGNTIGVTAVTVTYGKRWCYLREVLTALSAEEGISRIIVVDNGTEEDFTEEAIRIAGHNLEIVRMNRNLGSAVGFKVGLENALNDGMSEFIWLLDDDNLPERRALEELRRYYRLFEGVIERDKFVTVSLRSDRKQYRRVAQGEPVGRWFPRSNSFLGFHFFWAPFWRMVDFLRKIPERDDRAYLPYVELPAAPWGGMFFHRAVVEKHGFPDTNFFLYGDDTEFALRFRHSGGKIFLIPSSQLIDLEESWHSKKRVAPVMFLKNYAEAPSFRIYYAVRNSTYIWNKHFRKNKFLFALNRSIFLLMLKFYLFRRGEKERYLLIKKAVADGDSGIMGEREGL